MFLPRVGSRGCDLVATVVVHVWDSPEKGRQETKMQQTQENRLPSFCVRTFFLTGWPRVAETGFLATGARLHHASDGEKEEEKIIHYGFGVSRVLREMTATDRSMIKFSTSSLRLGVTVWFGSAKKTARGLNINISSAL